MKLNRANKKVKGFTLIELIVVIAIIGVLAAILVPQMMGYVKKSKTTTANSNAKSVFDAINTTCTDYEVQGITINGLTGVMSVAAEGDFGVEKAAFQTAVEAKLSFKSGAQWTANIDNGQVKATAYRESATDKYVGTCPKEATTESQVPWDGALTYAGKSTSSSSSSSEG